MQKFQLKVLDPRFAETFGLPAYATDGSAAMDIRACLDKTLTIKPGGCELIPTGFAVHIADPDICAILLPRSGLGFFKTGPDIHSSGTVCRVGRQPERLSKARIKYFQLDLLHENVSQFRRSDLLPV
jgi:dUTPase